MKFFYISVLVLGVSFFVFPRNPIPNATRFSIHQDLPEPMVENGILENCVHVSPLLSPESFAHAFDEESKTFYLFFSLQDGRVGRVNVEKDTIPKIEDVKYIVRTGTYFKKECDNYTYENEERCGRPLGLLYHDGYLYVAESYRSILRIPKSQLFNPNPRVDYEPEEIVNNHNGKRFMFLNALIAKNDTLYFTDSSMRYSRRDVNTMIYDGEGKEFLFFFFPGMNTIILSEWETFSVQHEDEGTQGSSVRTSFRQWCCLEQGRRENSGCEHQRCESHAIRFKEEAKS